MYQIVRRITEWKNGSYAGTSEERLQEVQSNNTPREGEFITVGGTKHVVKEVQREISSSGSESTKVYVASTATPRFRQEHY